MSSLLAKLGLGNVKVIRLPKVIAPPPVPRATTSEAELTATLDRILKERFVPFKSVTAAVRDEITTYEQHFADGRTNPKWLAARQNLATGSRLAGMVGLSHYERVDSTLMSMLWSTFRGNVATRWGSEHEIDAQESTRVYYESLNGEPNPVDPDEVQIDARIQELGMVRSIAFPFAGMSPDGVLVRSFKNTVTGAVRVQKQLLEFKCPYKRHTLNDHWPAYDLYAKERAPHVPGQPPSSIKRPVPNHYLTQLTWGGFIMGSHTTESILSRPNVPTPKLNEYMATCDAVEPTCGAGLVDTNYPILFIVWCPCQRLKNAIDVPECYYEDQEARSKFIRTCHGGIQLTEVDYDPDFASWLVEEVFDFWRFKYMPRLIKKNAGVLLKGELDVPCTISDSEEEDEE